MTGDQQLAEMLRCRDEALALCAQVSQLADRIIAIVGEQVPEPPGRRKRHLRVVPGPGA